MTFKWPWTFVCVVSHQSSPSVGQQARSRRRTAQTGSQTQTPGPAVQSSVRLRRPGHRRAQLQRRRRHRHHQRGWDGRAGPPLAALLARAAFRAELWCLFRCVGLVDGSPPRETGAVPQQLCDQDLAGSGGAGGAGAGGGPGAARPRPSLSGGSFKDWPPGTGSSFSLCSSFFFLVLNKNYLLPLKLPVFLLRTDVRTLLRSRAQTFEPLDRSLGPGCDCALAPPPLSFCLSLSLKNLNTFYFWILKFGVRDVKAELIAALAEVFI